MTDEQDSKSMSRRNFLGIAAAAVAGGGIVAGCGTQPPTKVNPVTDAQKAEKRKTDSPLAIVRCDSYEQEIFPLIKPLF